MYTELDKVKSTITISLGLKNRLRDAKGSDSYEAYIAKLLRMKNEYKDNYIELQKFQRKEKVYSFDDKKVIFSYNKYNRSENFVFDIKITNIRQDGKNILLMEILLLKKLDVVQDVVQEFSWQKIKIDYSAENVIMLNLKNNKERGKVTSGVVI